MGSWNSIDWFGGVLHPFGSISIISQQAWNRMGCICHMQLIFQASSTSWTDANWVYDCTEDMGDLDKLWNAWLLGHQEDKISYKMVYTKQRSLLIILGYLGNNFKFINWKNVWNLHVFLLFMRGSTYTLT